MHIAINASAIGKVKGGASFYIVNIIPHLVNLSSEHSYTIFCTSFGKKYFAGLNSNCAIQASAPQSVILRLIWEQIVLPFSCLRKKVTVLFSPNYTTPLCTPGFATVVTIHDLSFFPLSHLYPRSRRLFKPIIRASIKKANRVIAVSEFTRQDIGRYIGIKSMRKVSVVYNAADDRFISQKNTATNSALLTRYGITGKYILFTGFLEPRKNLNRLLEAYASLSSQLDHSLVIAGCKGWWYAATFDKVIQLGIDKKVIFTGYVDDDDLPQLYKNAAVFVFPSLYEGFGIAALESICCGTPVLAANNTALPEVVGEAGLYVDPYDSCAIAQALLKIVEPAVLKRLKENCSKASSQFSWKKAAEETLQILLSPR